MELSDVFRAGEDGVHTSRIPALCVSAEGTLLAFCEARQTGSGDAGDIDLVVRRSTDGGETWGGSITVWDDGANTCGNPTPVVHRPSGRVLLPMTWNLGTDLERRIIQGSSAEPRRVFMTHSDDDGISWAEAREMPHLRREYWDWYATGPGNAIELTRGPFEGRIVVPANHSNTSSRGHFYRAHVFYSDGGGASWTLGGVVGPATNESAVAELSDGSIMLNARSYAGANRRAVAISRDGGVSWGEPRLEHALIEPVCQASLLREYFASGRGSRPGSGRGKGRLLFANPASTTARERLTLRASRDDGEAWSVARTVYAGSSGYSSLAVLPNGSIGVLFERDGASKISLARIEPKARSSASALSW